MSLSNTKQPNTYQSCAADGLLLSGVESDNDFVLPRGYDRTLWIVTETGQISLSAPLQEEFGGAVLAWYDSNSNGLGELIVQDLANARETETQVFDRTRLTPIENMSDHYALTKQVGCVWIETPFGDLFLTHKVNSQGRVFTVMELWAKTFAEGRRLLFVMIPE